MVLSVLEAISSLLMVWYTLNTHSSADHPVFVYYIQGAKEPLVSSVFSTLPPTCILPSYRAPAVAHGSGSTNASEKEGSQGELNLEIRARAVSQTGNKKWLYTGQRLPEGYEEG